MSTSQAMRIERRRMQELQRRREAKQALQGAVAIVLILLAFAFAGTVDYLSMAAL